MTILRSSIHRMATLMCGLVLGAPVVAQTPLTVIYSGNLDGELEPCGCSLDSDFGGIQRQATFIDKQRAQDDNLVLINSGGLFSQELGADPIKDGFILSGVKALNYDAIGVQWQDLTHGSDFLTGSDLPFISANWKTDQLATSKTFTRKGVTFFFSQWLDPLTSPYRTLPALSPIHADSSVLAKELTQAENAGAVTILSTSLSLADAQQQLPLEAVDMLIIKSGYEQYAEPRDVDGMLVLQPGSRGQRLAKLELQISNNGELTAWKQQVFELPDLVPNAPRLDAWYANYNQALREDYEQRVKLRKAQKRDGNDYLGAEQCKTCHQAAYDTWSESEHAKAYDDLEVVGKAFDSHCIGCHVVGFMQPGGFLDINMSSHLTAVQCENCHGNGREHASSAGQTATLNKGKPKEALCSQCHVKEHSPGFNMEQYWPKIAHPLVKAIPGA